MLDEQGLGGRRLFELAKSRFDPEGRMNPGKLWAEAPVRPLPPPAPVRPEDLLLRCLPGEQLAAVERRATAQGATLGPMPAVETLIEAVRGLAGRSPSPRYGRPVDRVVSLTATLPDASPFRPTIAPRKAVGPDYVRLVLTAVPEVARVEELVLRLMPLPEVRRHLVLQMSDADRRTALDHGIRPATESWSDGRWTLVLEGPQRVVEAETAWLQALLEGALAGPAPVPEHAADHRP